MAERPEGTTKSDQHRMVDFYWRPGCPFCMSLRHSLKRAGVAVRPRNIWAEPEAAAQVRAVANGHETVPTIGFGGDHLVNPTAAEVVRLIATHDAGWAGEILAGQSPKRRRFRGRSQR